MRLLPFVFIAVAMTTSLALGSPPMRDDDKQLDTAPTGLASTNVSLGEILKRHAATSGESIEEDWSFVDTGLAGTEHLERFGTDYHSRITTGSITEDFGQYRGKRWHRDANGITSQTSEIDDRSFTAVRVREDANDPKNDVRVLGITADANPAYVLEVRRPQHPHPEWLFYDVKTGNITRVEYVAYRRRIIEIYDDFRTVDGVTQAWHVHDTYPDRTFDDDWRITAFHAGVTLNASSFAAPQSAAQITPAEKREPLAAQFDGFGDIIIRVIVNGRGLDFELDSSAPQSYIDRDVADELDLPTFGKATHASDGKKIPYDTIIPNIDIGPVHYRNFAIRAIPLSYRPSEHTKVVGFLGYDFLATNDIHIDYLHKIIEVIPTREFSSDKPIEKAVELPLDIDNGTPFIPMIIGDGRADRVILNTDVPFTMVFGPYQDAHAEQFQDLEQGRHRKAAVPFADDASFGQVAEVWWSRTPTLRFAIADYSNHPILATNFPLETSGRDIDAMVGIDYLRYFDLYFDFPHDRFFVKPNEWFFRDFSKGEH